MLATVSRLPKEEMTRALREEPNLNGTDLSNVDLSNVNLARVNLSGARLGGADLSGSYFHGAIARRTSFVGANMQGASLPTSAMEGAGFRTANLRSANLRWADLSGASLVDADLSDAQLSEAALIGAAFTNANMEGTRLESANLTDAILRGARLLNAVLHSATLQKADLYGANLQRCDLRGADLLGANLFDTRLEHAVYDEGTGFPDGFDTRDLGMRFLGPGADLPRADLSDFEFRGEDLSGANLSGANLVGSDLRSANLTGADLTQARLRRALYDANTRFPDDFDPALAGAYAVVPRTVIRSAKMAWKRLSGAALSGAQLEGADLTGADLTGAQLNSANLADATLYSANLTGAGLHAANLRGANLRGAILQDADLRRADLRNADLSWADLVDVDLRGAQLEGASLLETRLREARYDDFTAFPAGFDPSEARMMGGEIERLVSEDAADSHSERSWLAKSAGVSVSDLYRRGKVWHATHVVAWTRAVRGPAMHLVASVAVFAGVGWMALGIHPPPDPRLLQPRPSAPVASQPADSAPKNNTTAPLLAQSTTIAGSALIVVDYGRLYAPRPRTVDAAVAMAAPVVPIPDAGPLLNESAGLASAKLPTDPQPAPQPIAPTTTLDQATSTASVALSSDNAMGPSGTGARSIASMDVDAVAPAARPERIRAVATIQAPTTFDEPGQASHTVGTGIAPADASIVAAVADWRSVWESRDIGAFVGLYHPQAHTAQLDLGNRTVSQRGFTKARLTARAQSLFGAYSHIKVNIDNLSVERDGDLIVSSFDEDFVGWRAEPGSSPDFVDRGRHTLVYARDAHNEWRIVSEQWRPMAR